jgi:hypothetical protein
MIKEIYKKYFQKSKAFLYPALGIPRRTFVAPIDTYIAWEGLYDIYDCKLIVKFQRKDTDTYSLFEKTYLTGCPLYEKHFDIENGEVLYIFNLEGYKNDWDNFLIGKYSQLSKSLKKHIKQYYGEQTEDYKYMDSFLNPGSYFKVYSELLMVPVATLQNVGELCDIFDSSKEILKINIEVNDVQ